MSDKIKKNYKKILLIICILLLVFISPLLIEIFLKSGNIIGTLIRYYSTNGICF